MISSRSAANVNRLRRLGLFSEPVDQHMDSVSEKKERTSLMRTTKREFLILATGAAAAAFVGLPPTKGSAAAVEEKIAEFLGGASAEEGGISLEMPEIAENGNVVPLTVSVDGDPAEGTYAESVAIFADGNPLPQAVTFHFTPMSGYMDASTRMRLAQTQNITAIAKMTDGTFRKTETVVKVTIGGCGG